MAMHIGGGADDDVLATINTTPLVDVMLVLLIIFLITIPVVTHAIKVDLPKDVSQPRIVNKETVNLSITRQGAVFWNDQPIAAEALPQRLAAVAGQTPQPEIQIHGDGDAAYASVGQVVTACRRAGIAKIGFITEPPPRQ